VEWDGVLTNWRYRAPISHIGVRACNFRQPRGEPVVRCPTDAIARRPTSTSRGSPCASSGHTVVRPPTARRLSAAGIAMTSRAADRIHAGEVGAMASAEPVRLLAAGEHRVIARLRLVADAITPRRRGAKVTRSSRLRTTSPFLQNVRPSARISGPFATQSMRGVGSAAVA